MSIFQPAPPVDAGSGNRGLINILAQSIAGVKTFLSAVIMSAGLTINGAVNQMVKVSPPATVSGQGFATPTIWIQTSALNQTNLIQIGSGLGSSEWELQIGYYGGAGAPIIASRAGPILVSLASGQALVPLTPGANDLGSVGNYWRKVIATNGYFSGIGYGEFDAAAGGFYFRTATSELGMQNAGGGSGIFFNAGSGASRCTGAFNVAGNAKAAAFLCDTGGAFFPETGGTGTAVYAGAATSKLNLRSSAGVGATDVCVVAGAGPADGSIHPSAKLLSLGTGMSGTYVEKLSVAANGNLTAPGVIATGGLAVNAGGADITGGVRLNDEKPITLSGGSLPEDLTTPPIGMDHVITINAAKGRGIFSGTFGHTTVNCDQCTAESVVIVMMEEEIGGNNPYAVTPNNGYFEIKTDGSGYYDSLFRFVVFN